MENIIKGIRQYYPVSDSSLEVLFSHMEKLELPKKHLLIRGGVADRHVYFIEKGFCRSYCLHDGEEITIWFSREGDITFAMKDLNRIYETNIEIANWGRVIHQECLLYMDMHHINQLYLPAKERYEQLLREQPDVIHRAQLGYIASFLGMTPQHLSRLRSES